MVAENPEALSGVGRAGAGYMAWLGKGGRQSRMLRLDAWAERGRPGQEATDEGHTVSPGAREPAEAIVRMTR